MSAIPRKLQKVFGGSLAANLNVAQFGSLKAGSPAYSLDPDVIQGLAAWLQAWGGAVVTVGGNPNVPPLQDMNAVFLVLSQQIAYLLQSGIPEYLATETYFIGGQCRVGGVNYVSRVDNNIGNTPASSPTQWAEQQTGSYPAGASGPASQVVNIDTAGHIVAFATELFDPNSAYNPATYKYTAPTNGVYQVSATLQVDNNTGAAATMETSIRVVKNSATIVLVNGTAVPNPPGSRWYPNVSGLVLLSAGDTLEIQFEASDTVNTGNVTLSNGNFSINRVRAT